MSIEKNAVLGNQQQGLLKKASSGCPICGSNLEFDGSLPRCPVHGTGPFERQSMMSNSRPDPFTRRR